MAAACLHTVQVLPLVSLAVDILLKVVSPAQRAKSVSKNDCVAESVDESKLRMLKLFRQNVRR